MDVCVKQEELDSEFESGSASMTSPWEMYGSWVDTHTPSHPRHYDTKSTELVIPLIERSKLLKTDTYQFDESADRAKREFIPDDRKDSRYWAKRLKNNASARRSRMKKKIIEQHMETKLQELQRENIELKYELAALRRHFAGQMDPKHDSYEASSDSRSDLSMRAGSASDSSDTSSVTSEGEHYRGPCDIDNVVAASPLSALTASSSANNHIASKAFSCQTGWHIPFNYSFMQYSLAEKNHKDDGSANDNELEPLTKVPHKFRHKKDFHSAFYGQQYAENKL